MKNRVSESNILLRCLCLNIKMFRSFSEKKKKNNSDIKEKEEEENRILFLPLRSFRTIHLKHRVSAMKCYEIMIGHWMMFTRILVGYHYTYKKINMHFYLKLYPRLNSYV